MDEAVVRSIGLNIEPCDVVIFVTKDGLTPDDLEILDPMIQDISETFDCSIITIPESVFSNIQLLDLQQLLSLRETIDEAIVSKMSADNIPTA